MTKSELIKAVATSAMLPARDVETVLSALTALATAELASGGEVTIPGLVKLKTRQRAARMSRNPTTNEPVQVPAKTVATAKPVKQLADAVA
ncbi:MAG: HU family DNA-binding protein [Paracoccus sp. (in: a-proteobacteria)]